MSNFFSKKLLQPVRHYNVSFLLSDFLSLPPFAKNTNKFLEREIYSLPPCKPTWMQICTPYIFAKQNLLHLTYSVQVVVECRRGSCDVSTLLERMGENWNNEYMLMGFSESHIFCCSMIYDFHFTQSTNIHWNLNFRQFFLTVYLPCPHSLEHFPGTPCFLKRQCTLSEIKQY